ncbi:MAG TPA: MBL fold metallo-hydrolase [bacterium]|nr:MBL fold metallo-hydrolase [bacterium]HPN46223.1 MBL fold metallo-hydrolase [bacterium]
MKKIIYTQLNKDSAYWPEKAKSGTRSRGGHTCGLLSVLEDEKVVLNILIDAGLGCIEALGDLPQFDWNAPLYALITHGHPDHHLELMILSELYCKRMNAERKAPLQVWCTEKTYREWLLPVHNYGFNPGGEPNTLAFHVVEPGTIFNIGPVKLTAIAGDHFRGDVIYIAEFGIHKIILGWDIKTLPDPDDYPVLKSPSLALIEANTLYRSEKSGHTSAEQLCVTGFLQKLEARRSSGQTGPPYGIYFVHFGGRPDEEKQEYLGDEEFMWLLENKYGEFLPRACVGMAGRLQQWIFNME